MDEETLEAEANILITGRSECEMDGVRRVIESLSALIDDTPDKCLNLTDLNVFEDYINYYAENYF